MLKNSLFLNKIFTVKSKKENSIYRNSSGLCSLESITRFKFSGRNLAHHSWKRNMLTIIAFSNQWMNIKVVEVVTWEVCWLDNYNIFITYNWQKDNDIALFEMFVTRWEIFVIKYYLNCKHAITMMHLYAYEYHVILAKTIFCRWAKLYKGIRHKVCVH